MSYLKSIMETAGLSLLSINEEEKNLVINEIFQENSVNIIEMFIAKDFLFANKDLMTKKQRNDFATIVYFCNHNKKSEFARQSSNSDNKLLYFCELKSIQELKNLSENFNNLNKVFNGNNILSKKEKITEYTNSDIEKSKKKKVILPRFYKETADLNEEIPKLTDKEVFSIFKTMRDHRQHCSNILNILSKNKVKTKADIFAEKVKKISTNVILNIDIKAMVKQVKSKDDLAAYYYFKTVYEREIINLFPDMEKIISACAKSNGINFTKEDINTNLKENKVLKSEYKKLTKFFELLPKFNITDKYLNVFPFLNKEESGYENFLNMVMFAKKNIVVSRNNKNSLYQEGITKDDSNFECLKAQKEFKMLFCEVVINERFKVDEEITIALGEDILNKMFGKQNLFDEYYSVLSFNNIAHLDKTMNYLVDILKTKKITANPNAFKINELAYLVNPYIFAQNITLDEFKNYVKELEDKSVNSKEDAMKLLVVHSIFVGAVGKSLILRNHENYNSQSAPLMVEDDEKLYAKFFYLSEIANVGNLFKMSKGKTGFYSIFLENFFEYKERGELTVGVSHSGFANRIYGENSWYLESFETDKDLNKERDIRFLFNQSTKILKSILDHSPEIVVFLYSIAPFSELKEKNYLEVLINEVRKEDKYKQILENIDLGKALVEYDLWEEIVNRDTTPALRNILENNLLIHDKNLITKNITYLNNLLTLTNYDSQIVNNQSAIDYLENTNLSKLEIKNITNILEKDVFMKKFLGNLQKSNSNLIEDLNNKLREFKLIETLEHKDIEKDLKKKKKI